MNPITASEARSIISGIKKAASELSNTISVICPPFLYLSLMKPSEKVLLGAQDAFWEMNGARTGEISAEMVNNAGAQYVILGHSERRVLGDTEEIINKKIVSAIRAGLSPIVCVGESVRDEHGTYFEFIKNQIHAVLSKVKRGDMKKVVIAYEPLWAIGKSDVEAATPAIVHEMSIFIRKVIADLYDQNSASSVKVLYGGSVSARNAHDFLKESNVNGLLVGRDSLNAKNFGEILAIAESVGNSK
jgi:triosephosphate isomerase